MALNSNDWEIKGMKQIEISSFENSRHLVTVITPSLNSFKTISENLISVLTARTILQRDHWELEHILIDGGSSDGTTDIVAGHASRHEFCRWMANVSGGPYAAMNVGLRQARGRYAHVLNSDDLLLDPEAYAKFLLAGHRNKASVLLASIGYFRRPARHVRSLWLVDPISINAMEWRDKLKSGLHYPHPGFIANLDIYKQHSFDEKYTLSADYKLMQSILLAQPPQAPPMVCQSPLVAMAEGGVTGNWKGVLQGIWQLDAINQELGIQSNGVRRYWSKLKQRLRPLPQPILIPSLEDPAS